MNFLATGVFQNQRSPCFREYGVDQKVGCFGRVQDPEGTADGKVWRTGDLKIV